MIRSKEFELVPETSDLTIRAYGINLEELFINSLKGMFVSVKPQAPQVHYIHDVINIRKFTVEHKIYIESNNLKELLVDFLSEALYLGDENQEAYFDAKFSSLQDNCLEAKIYGVKITSFDVSKIEAIISEDIEIEQVDSLWVATLVFDN